MTAELTPIKRLHRIIPLIEINDVYLKGSSIDLLEHHSAVRPDRTLIHQKVEGQWVIDPDKSVLTCIVTRSINGFEKKSSIEDGDSEEGGSLGRQLFLFKASFYVVYMIKNLDEENEAFFDDDETLKIFTETNAVFNSYPYFREYFHSQCMRTGMEPIILPFLKPLTVKDINEKYSSPEVEKEAN